MLTTEIIGKKMKKEFFSKTESVIKKVRKKNGGTKESLNGEKNNYQFSARAVVDRYKK